MRLLAVVPLVVLTLVAAPARAQASSLPVAVAARALARGEVLRASDIVWADGDAQTGGTARQVAAGWVTRRVIAAGEPLRAPAIAPPPMVRANEPVTLVVRRGGAELALRGIASRDATAGERVIVRVDAARRFEGIVESPGHVRLP